jgi:hypothetical protein
MARLTGPCFCRLDYILHTQTIGPARHFFRHSRQKLYKDFIEVHISMRFNRTCNRVLDHMNM